MHRAQAGKLGTSAIHAFLATSQQGRQRPRQVGSPPLQTFLATPEKGRQGLPQPSPSVTEPFAFRAQAEVRLALYSAGALVKQTYQLGLDRDHPGARFGRRPAFCVTD